MPKRKECHLSEIEKTIDKRIIAEKVYVGEVFAGKVCAGDITAEDICVDEINAENAFITNATITNENVTNATIANLTVTETFHLPFAPAVITVDQTLTNPNNVTTFTTIQGAIDSFQSLPLNPTTGVTINVVSTPGTIVVYPEFVNAVTNPFANKIRLTHGVSPTPPGAGIELVTINGDTRQVVGCGIVNGSQWTASAGPSVLPTTPVGGVQNGSLGNAKFSSTPNSLTVGVEGNAPLPIKPDFIACGVVQGDRVAIRFDDGTGTIMIVDHVPNQSPNPSNTIVFMTNFPTGKTLNTVHAMMCVCPNVVIKPSGPGFALALNNVLTMQGFMVDGSLLTPNTQAGFFPPTVIVNNGTAATLLNCLIWNNTTNGRGVSWASLPGNLFRDGPDTATLSFTQNDNPFGSTIMTQGIPLNVAGGSTANCFAYPLVLATLNNPTQFAFIITSAGKVTFSNTVFLGRVLIGEVGPSAGVIGSTYQDVNILPAAANINNVAISFSSTNGTTGRGWVSSSNNLNTGIRIRGSPQVGIRAANFITLPTGCGLRFASDFPNAVAVQATAPPQIYPITNFQGNTFPGNANTTTIGLSLYQAFMPNSTGPVFNINNNSLVRCYFLADPNFEPTVPINNGTVAPPTPPLVTVPGITLKDTPTTVIAALTDASLLQIDLSTLVYNNATAASAVSGFTATNGSTIIYNSVTGFPVANASTGTLFSLSNNSRLIMPVPNETPVTNRTFTNMAIYVSLDSTSTAMVNNATTTTSPPGTTTHYNVTNLSNLYIANSTTTNATGLGVSATFGSNVRAIGGTFTGGTFHDGTSRII